VSLTYDDPTAEGKSGGHTDTYHGHFQRLVHDREVVEVVEFETDDPRMQGAMSVTTTLTPDGDATRVTMSFETCPPASRRLTTSSGPRSRWRSLPGWSRPHSGRGGMAGRPGAVTSA
jgi:hypothetical protein